MEDWRGEGEKGRRGEADEVKITQSNNRLAAGQKCSAAETNADIQTT